MEEWKDVIGYEGSYQVSNTEKVKNLSRVVRRGSSVRRIRERILKPSIGKRGYLVVSLSKNCRIKTFCLHTLLLEAFVEPRPEGMECRHLDGNKLNNKLDNLKWGTRSENIKDAMKHTNFNMGSNQGNSKLKEEEVWLIRKILKANVVTQRYISKMFKVSERTIGNIKIRKVWRCV